VGNQIERGNCFQIPDIVELVSNTCMTNDLIIYK